MSSECPNHSLRPGDGERWEATKFRNALSSDLADKPTLHMNNLKAAEDGKQLFQQESQ
jgi:hypothetical protein